MNSRKDDALAISAEKEKLEKELVAIQGKLADKQEKLQTATDSFPTSKRIWMPFRNARNSLRKKPTNTP